MSIQTLVEKIKEKGMELAIYTGYTAEELLEGRMKTDSAFWPWRISSLTAALSWIKSPMS